VKVDQNQKLVTYSWLKEWYVTTQKFAPITSSIKEAMG